MSKYLGKGRVSFVRARIAGPKPRTFADHLERLKANAPGSQKVATADGVEVAWTAGKHVRDEDFSEEKNIFPDHLLFDFWMQTNKLPKDRLKVYYETDLKALIANNPSGFPSARQKREAKESARDRLEQEAKDGRWLKWATSPCAWDATRGELFFGGGLGQKFDRLCELWERTFVATLVDQQQLSPGLQSITAGSLAERVNPQAIHENLSAFCGGQPLDRPAWCPDEKNIDFLGNEFLLWLWYTTDRVSDTIALPDDSEATVMFRGGLRVEDPRGQTGDTTSNSESAVRLPEARAAIRAGKLPRKACLTVVRHDEQYDFKLDAETLAVSSAKLPPVDAEITGRGRDERRLQSLRDLAETIDLMFAAFLDRRLSAYWAEDLAEIQGWLTGGQRMAA